MPLNDLYLGESGGFEVKLSAFGRKFSEGEEEFSREERTANARLVKDRVNKKSVFKIDYSLIDDPDLQDILTLSEFESELTFKIRRLDNTLEHFNVLMKPFNRDRILVVGGGLWGGVSFTLRQV